jgi:hypothetical protein
MQAFVFALVSYFWEYINLQYQVISLLYQVPVTVIASMIVL